jgi:hypothetical protein
MFFEFLLFDLYNPYDMSLSTSTYASFGQIRQATLAGNC